MLRRLYDWTMGLAAHPHALRWLAALSFAESSFFPIPPDALMIPMVLAQRARALVIATVCTAASVVGGLAGYAIGYFVFEAVGQRIVDFYGLAPQMAGFRASFNEWGWWIIVIKGMTPIPYKLITIASGVAGFDLAAFVGASIISRSIRFYLVAALLWWAGPPIRAFIERYLKWVTTAFAALVIGGFVLVRYL